MKKFALFILPSHFRCYSYAVIHIQHELEMCLLELPSAYQPKSEKMISIRPIS